GSEKSALSCQSSLSDTRDGSGVVCARTTDAATSENAMRRCRERIRLVYDARKSVSNGAAYHPHSQTASSLMRFRNIITSRRAFASAIAVVAIASAGIGIARASDHQDNPLVELNPASDMTDVYAFPGTTPDRVVLVMNSWAFL